MSRAALYFVFFMVGALLLVSDVPVLAQGSPVNTNPDFDTGLPPWTAVCYDWKDVHTGGPGTAYGVMAKKTSGCATLAQATYDPAGDTAPGTWTLDIRLYMGVGTGAADLRLYKYEPSSTLCDSKSPTPNGNWILSTLSCTVGSANDKFVILIGVGDADTGLNKGGFDYARLIPPAATPTPSPTATPTGTPVPAPDDGWHGAVCYSTRTGGNVSANLLDNSSFELGFTWPTDWEPSNPPNGAYTRGEPGICLGSDCLHAGDVHNGWGAWSFVQDLGTLPDADYIFGANVYADGIGVATPGRDDYGVWGVGFGGYTISAYDTSSCEDLGGGLGGPHWSCPWEEVYTQAFLTGDLNYGIVVNQPPAVDGMTWLDKAFLIPITAGEPDCDIVDEWEEINTPPTPTPLSTTVLPTIGAIGGGTPLPVPIGITPLPTRCFGWSEFDITQISQTVPHLSWCMELDQVTWTSPEMDAALGFSVYPWIVAMASALVVGIFVRFIKDR